MSDYPAREPPFAPITQVTQYELAKWLFQQIEMRTAPCETREECLDLMAECVATVRVERVKLR